MKLNISPSFSTSINENIRTKEFSHLYNRVVRITSAEISVCIFNKNVEYLITTFELNFK